MKRCDNRHSQFTQECENVTAGSSAENAELELQTDDVYDADHEEDRRTQVR
jgi:hypothetical protein